MIGRSYKKLHEVTWSWMELMTLHEVRWSEMNLDEVKLRKIEESLTKDVKNMISWEKSDEMSQGKM